MEIIQMVYPPSDLISYSIFQSQDAAIDAYPEYFVISSPASSAASSTSTSPFPAPHHALDNRISRIPLSSSSSASPSSSTNASSAPGLSLITGQAIYLSGDAGANDFTNLSALGITHILNITDCIPNYYEGTTNIVYMRVSIADCGSIILKDYFPAVFEFITNALDAGGQVLVHCFAGKSRSASFVIAYLMQSSGLSYMDALRHVQKHRPVIEPNFGFELQLNAFEAELLLHQSHHSHHSQNANHCDTTIGDE
jgi:atypical dual specificity phosphatase